MAKEYIEREAVKRELLSWAVSINHPEYLIKDDALHIIDSFPAADVAPVVHAHWQPYEDTVQCSACGFGTFMDGYFFVHGECTHANDRSFRFSFCPNCGAKMDGDMIAAE